MTASTLKMNSSWFVLKISVLSIITAVGLYKMICAIVDISDVIVEKNNKHSHFIKGYLFGREYYDATDFQWRVFRESLPLGVCMLLSYTIFANLIEWSLKRIDWKNWSRLSPNDGSPVSCFMKRPRISARFLLSFLYLFLLHGVNMVIIGVFVVVFYLFAKISNRASREHVVVVWTIALVMLKIIDVGKSTHGGLSYFGWRDFVANVGLFTGAYGNWEALFNLTILKMLSFSLDEHFYWKEKTDISGDNEEKKSLLIQKHCENCTECTQSSNPSACRKYRILCGSTDFNENAASFDFINYWTYIFYLPLFIAGPLVTFNDFKYQMSEDLAIRSQLKVQIKQIVRAVLNWCLVGFVFETFNHFIYVKSVNTSVDFKKLSFIQLAAYSYFVLKFMWLKFLLIWRFFRIGALVDGIDAPENMLRCMSNTYSTMGFWRSWHSSFNQWIIRYLYIPLGGNRSIWWNIWIVFLFVGVWHNFTTDLLAWGFLIALFIMPEMICNQLAHRFKWDKLHWWNALRGLGATFNVFFMITSNIVGYAGGVTKMKLILIGLFKKGEINSANLFGTIFVLYSIIQLMFVVREWEQYNVGKSKNY